MTMQPQPIATSSADALASFASQLRFDDIPNDVREHTKRSIMDSVACGLYGTTLPWTATLTRTVLAMDGGGPGVLWGGSHTASIAHAALVNGAAVHAYELDDLHPGSIVHVGSVVIPAAMAIAALRDHEVDGTTLLTAIVAGYEVVARVGMSVGAAHLLQGWHPTGTHGTFGAAVAAGVMLGLGPEQLAHAIGIAGSQSSGLMASQYGAMVKRFHAGRASQSGVYAAMLAADGYTGTRDVLEADYGGYCTTVSPRHTPEALVSGLGSTWETRAIGFKIYSTNGSCHPSIALLLDMIDAHDIRPDDVARVRVRVSSATKEHVGWPYLLDSVTTAQMNLPYIVAVVLADRAAFVDQFGQDRITDPELVAFTHRVEVVADPAIDARGDGHRHETHLEVVLTDGRTLSGSRMHAPGSAKEPVSERGLLDKFRVLAGKAVTPEQAERLLDTIHGLESSSVAALARHLTVA